MLTLAALWAVLNFSSCVKDIQEIKVDTWEPELAIPILNATVSIQDLLDEADNTGFIEKDSDNFLTLVYEGEVLSQRADEIIALPDFAVPMIQSDQTVPYANLPFAFDLDKVILKKGTFTYNMESNLAQDANVTIQFPNFKKDGQMLEMSMVVGSSTTMNSTFDLTGYEIDFSSDLNLKYVAIEVNDTQEKELDNVNFAFSDLEYSYVEGALGQYNFSLPLETLELDVFKDVTDGSIYFEDPKIELTFNNSFGFPIEIKSDVLRAKTNSSGMMNITTPLDAGVSFNYPALTEVGTSKTTVVTFDKSNTNISDVIEANPFEFDYEFTAQGNPNNVNAVGFTKDDSQFSVDLNVELPLWFKAQGFTYETTEDFDISDIENLERIEFKLITENGLPLQSNMQVFFEDDNGNVLGQLFDNTAPVISAASVDTDGKVTAPGEHTEVVTIDESKLAQITSATKIRLQADFATGNDGADSARIYTDYDINFKMGAKAIIKKEN